MPGRGATAILLLCLCSAGGCAPEVRFESCRCDRVMHSGRLEALAFVSTFEASRLARRQIVYQVRLIGRDGRPIRSVDGRYQTASGTVGATRTFPVYADPQVLRDVRVSIPAGELGIAQKDVPVTAEVAVLLAGGQTLATQTCAVPVGRAEELMPPLEAAPPQRRDYWFALPPLGEAPPVLIGPYATAEQAAAAFPQPEARARRIRPDEYAWFVPLRSPGGHTQWMGPCELNLDAMRLAQALDAAIKDRRAPLRTAPPVRLRLRTWLDQQTLTERGARHTAGLGALEELGVKLPSPRSQPATRAAPASRPAETATRPVETAPRPPSEPAVLPAERPYEPGGEDPAERLD